MSVAVFLYPQQMGRKGVNPTMRHVSLHPPAGKNGTNPIYDIPLL